MIDTRVETFLTLCRVMNYRRTAELLHMTQPAVTQHIHFLEARYGCKLFRYDHRHLVMTKEAELLKRCAENVLYQEKKLKGELNRRGGLQLSIGATKTIGEYVIGPHVAAFLADPENRISVSVENTEALLDSLSGGRIDFALVEGNFDRSRYSSRLYRQEPFVGLCAAGHPFANRTVPLDRIWSNTLLLREEGSGTRNILRQLLHANSHALGEFARICTVSSFGLMTALLAQNAGITFAYRAVGAANPALAEFRVEGWEVTRALPYVYLDTPYSEYAVKVFDAWKNSGLCPVPGLSEDTDSGTAGC